MMFKIGSKRMNILRFYVSDSLKEFKRERDEYERELGAFSTLYSHSTYDPEKKLWIGFYKYFIDE